MIHYTVLVFIVLLYCIKCDKYFSNSLTTVNATEAFIFKFHPSMYNWTEAETQYGMKYFLLMNGVFELPPWMGFRNEFIESSLYIFGSAPVSVSFFTLQITAMNQGTFESRLHQLNVTVEAKNETDYAKYAVQIMVHNVNINDLYNSTKLQDFKSIFDNHFWKNSRGKSYITLFQSAELVPGIRYPLNPVEKEGVLVHIGSPYNYSRELFMLEREVRPSTKNICPGYFKRMTVERYIRNKNLIFNWCYFHLIKPRTDLVGTIDDDDDNFDRISTNVSGLDKNILKLPEREKLFTSHVSQATFTMIWPPLLLSFILFIWLTILLCVNMDKLEDPYSNDYFDSLFYVWESCCRGFRYRG